MSLSTGDMAQTREYSQKHQRRDFGIAQARKMIQK